MENQKTKNSRKITGLEIFCHICGCELPLMHPHIMLERNDDNGNVICEECYQNLCEIKKICKH